MTFRWMLVGTIFLVGCGPTRAPKTDAPGKPEVQVEAAAKVPAKAPDAPAKVVDPATSYSGRLAVAREAVEKGRISEVKQLLLEQLDINDKADDGTTPLMWAVRKGQLSMSLLLLSKGANTGERDNTGRTLFMHAVEGGNTDIVRMLLSPTDAVSGAGALLKAAGIGGDFKLTSILRGGEAEARTNDGQTALMLAVTSGRPDIVRILGPANDTLVLVDKQGQSALMLAAAGGQDDIVDYLLSQHRRDLKGFLAMVRQKDAAGRTASEIAAAAGRRDIAAALAEAAIDPEERDKNGQTALMRAIEAGDASKGIALHQRGVSVLAKDEKGRTALHLAANRGLTDLFNVCSYVASSYPDRTVIFNAADADGRNVLAHAVLGNSPGCISSMIGNGAEIYGRQGFRDMVLALAKNTDKEGQNALHLGVAAEKVAGVNALFEAFGASTNADLPGPAVRKDYANLPNHDGVTPLQMAEKTGNVAMIELLRRHGAVPENKAKSK